jgi:hypothetical protein
MRKKRYLIPLLISMVLAGCISDGETDLSVAKLLENPSYDEEVAIYGKVSLLGELFCPCFALTSEGKMVHVWYGLMTEDDGTERPPVSVGGIKNGEWVRVTGELKSEGKYRTKNDFWASNIDVIDDPSTLPTFGGEMTEEKSREMARAFIESSPTYAYDGSDLVHKETLYPEIAGCEHCYTFVFVFTSRHSGYGDRRDQIVAQVLTPHEAHITTENGEIISANLDGYWNMLTQQSLE